MSGARSERLFGAPLSSREGSARTLDADGLSFGILEMGTGPLALCLHGFPDSAHTWRHLLPVLADAGFHAVAPFMRGYSPTGVPNDGCYSLGALAHDAVAIHDAVGGDDHAVLIGHDWGAEAAYVAAAFAPDRWRTLVAMSAPPPALDAVLLRDYEQLKNFFYHYALLTPDAEELVSGDGMAFLDRLWAEWSPGYDADEDLRLVKECLASPVNLSAAIGYYRAELAGGPECDRYAASDAAVGRMPPHPALYLHGRSDGCIRVDLIRDVLEHLAPRSRAQIVEHAGHFLQLERPAEVNELILDWITR